MTEVYVARAFCKDGQGGNPAGVVLEGAALSRNEKQNVARGLGYSETVFVYALGEGEYALEYFTPTEEVPLCGHATIAAFSVLDHLGLLDRRQYMIRTKAGRLRIQREADGMILMEQSLPQYGEVLRLSELEGCFDGLHPDPLLPIQIVSTGLRDILLPVASAAQLEEMVPRAVDIAALSREKTVVGIHAFSVTNQPEVAAVCRNFAPLYGIEEEAATGTSNCALACYLFRHWERRDRYIFEQGECLGQPSRIVVKLLRRGDEIDAVFVGGFGRVTEKRALP